MPWYCIPLKACHGDEDCVFLYGLPMQFIAEDTGNGTLTLADVTGSKRPAVIVRSREVTTNSVPEPPLGEPDPLVLLRTREVQDTNGFWVYAIWKKGNGKRFLAEERFLITCNSISRAKSSTE